MILISSCILVAYIMNCDCILVTCIVAPYVITSEPVYLKHANNYVCNWEVQE